MLKTSGIHVTTVTPFKESFELDLEGVKENIGFLLETEISSVVPLGTVGEFGPESQPLGLPSGRHHVELREPGFQVSSFDVDIAAGQVIPYQGELEP